MDTAQSPRLGLQVVGEQVSRGWPRGRRPRCGWRITGFRFVAEECSEVGHARHAITDDVVQPDEQADAPVWQSRQEPHLPQRAAPVESPAPKALHRVPPLG